MSFLRLITDTRLETPEVTKTGTKAFWQTIGGVHLFASVINISAFIIFGDALKKNGRLDRTTATSIQRGFALAALWSPFFAAMGTCLLYAQGQNGFIYFHSLFPLPCWVLRLPGRNTASEKTETWIRLRDIRLIFAHCGFPH